jgi:SAM-dependent methyltransferase
MFHRLAEYYDPLLTTKDYRAEVRRLERIVRRHSRSRATAWLDVACGTGRHLEYLRQKYTVTGVDASPEMLGLARRRLPGTRLVLADMRTFRLGATFDVVTCLFSAIGHLRTELDLRTAFENFARHTNPGGVVIVEPWIDPAQFRSGFLHVVTSKTPEVAIVRMAFSTRRGRRSSVRYHYLIGKTGRGIRHVEETDVGLLVSPRRLVELMRPSGLKPTFLRNGLTSGRGLLVGVRPGTRPTDRG